MAIYIAKIPNSVFRKYPNKNTVMLEEAILNGILLPDDATNGDVIKALFSHHDIEVNEQKNYVQVFYDSFYTTYPLRWWLEPYKAGDTE